MSDQTGQNTLPETPSFSAFPTYGPTRISEIKVKSLSGKTTGIDPKTVMVSGETPGTFAARPLAPKTVTYNIPVAKLVVGGEMKKGPSAAELEEMRLKAEYHAELTKIGLDLKDMIYRADELREKKLRPETLAFLDSAQEDANDAFAEAHGEPNETRMNLLNHYKAEFIEALEKAETEALALPPEIDQEKELHANILKLSGLIIKATQHGRALEEDISDATFLKTFKESRVDLERALIDLTDHPDEAKRKKLEEDAAHYQKNIESAEEFIANNPKTVANTSPAPATNTPSTAPTFTQEDLYGPWLFNKIEDQAGRNVVQAIFDEYRRFIREVEKTKQTDAFPELLEKKKLIAKLLADRDKSVFTELEHFKEVLRESKEVFRNNTERDAQKRELESGRAQLLKEIERVLDEKNSQNYYARIQDMEDRGLSGETKTTLIVTVGTFVGEVKNLKTSLGEFSPEELRQALENLKEKEKEVETLLANESAKQTVFSSPKNFNTLKKEPGEAHDFTQTPLVTVLRPFKLADTTKDASFTNGNTGQDIADEQAVVQEAKRLHEEGEKKKGYEDTREIFEGMFERAPAEFKQKYTVRGKGDGDEYFMSPELMKHPYKELIVEILTDSTNPNHLENLFEPTRQDKLEGRARQEREASARERAAREARANSSLGSYKTAYSPALDKDEKNPKLLKARPSDPKTDEEALARAQALKDAQTTKNEEALPKMKLDAQHQDLESMVARKGVPIENMVKAPEKAPEKEEKKEKLSMVEKLMFTLKVPHLGAYTSTAILFTALAVVAGDTNTSSTEKNQTVAQSQEDGRTWEKYWAERFDAGLQEMPDDMRTKKPEQLIQKYFPSYFKDTNNPARVSMALNMFGYDVASNTMQNTYNLTDIERRELTKWRTALDSMYFTLTAQHLKKENRHLIDEIRDVQQAIAAKEA
jgi:hypothetical protein